MGIRVSLRADAVEFARRECGFLPDELQGRVLRGRRGILNCSRQWGKSTVSAVKALHVALQREKQTVVVVAPTQRQSAELLRRCREFEPAREAGVKSSANQLTFANGSRILALPGTGDTIRGFSANLLIIDEAARVPDTLYHSLVPMLAATKGQVWLLSTPNGPRGFFYQEWMDRAEDWERIHAPATECPRLAGAFLERERKKAARRGQMLTFRQEYLCEFTDTGTSVVFPAEVLGAAVKEEVAPLFVVGRSPRWPSVKSRFFLGLDLGRRRDHSALVIAEMRRYATGARSAVTLDYVYENRFEIRHVERIPLGMKYSDLASYVAGVLETPELRQWPCDLVMDATGVGDAVLEMMKGARLRAQIVPVRITGGTEVSRNGEGEYLVPKGELVGNLENLFHEEMVEIAAECPHTGELLDELTWFERTKLGTGRVTYAAARESVHDDLVVAMMLACWRGFEVYGRRMGRRTEGPGMGPLW